MKNIMLKLKSNKGFTLQDLLIACFIIVLFVGLISTLMISTYRSKIKANLLSQITIYAVQILEDIDKISYEDVQEKTVQEYREQFSIPSEFDVQLEISNYGQGIEGMQDVIKVIKLRLSYTFNDETEEFVVKKLKIKEI